MDNIDLNIDNYDLNDILKLFKLDYNFNESELKEAKKIVLQTHPDKSGLNSDYFIFFGKAYKILHYIFQVKKSKNNNSNVKYEELLAYSSKEDKVLKNLKKSENFSKIFNEVFENIKIKNEFNEKGYGDWLTKNENKLNHNEVYSIQDMHKFINNKRKELAKNNEKNNIDTLSLSHHYSLTQAAPASYQSDLFSNLQYEDVKKAYTETIIPVEENKKKTNLSLQHLKNLRNSQNITPYDNKKSNEILKQQENEENILNTHRAFILAKQNEMAEIAQKNAISKFYKITN